MTKEEKLICTRGLAINAAYAILCVTDIDEMNFGGAKKHLKILKDTLEKWAKKFGATDSDITDAFIEVIGKDYTE